MYKILYYSQAEKREYAYDEMLGYSKESICLALNKKKKIHIYARVGCH
jgi:hypothetical protein